MDGEIEEVSHQFEAARVTGHEDFGTGFVDSLKGDPLGVKR